jgi:hypothetical protein
MARTAGTRGVAASAGLAAGVAYLLLAGDVLFDAGAALAGAVGAIAVAACALAPLAGRDEPVALGVFGLGAALLAVALNGRDVVVGATPVEALFGAAAGLLFAYGFAVPAAVVALPLVVAGIDAASLLGGAPEASARSTSDLLTLHLPAWGSGAQPPVLGLLDATFLALFAAWSLRFGLRPRAAIALMVLALAGAVALSVAVGRALPTVPFLAVGFLLPALDRLPALLRSEG